MTTDKNTPLPSPFVLVPETVTMTACPRSTILKYSKVGQFPQVIRLLGNRIAFSRADVQNWINTRLATTARSANDE